jgi:hypothetical protein
VEKSPVAIVVVVVIVVTAAKQLQKCLFFELLVYHETV